MDNNSTYEGERHNRLCFKAPQFSSVLLIFHVDVHVLLYSPEA